MATLRPGMVSRRSALRAAGAALAGLAGCLEGSPDEGADPSPSPETTTPPATAFPDVETPAPGECSATAPPYPDTGERLPEPRPYPDGPPTMTADGVRSFLDAYESAYLHNDKLREVDAEGRCLSYLDVSVDGVELRATAGGYAATVSWFRGFQATRCATPTGTDTPTPGPHADLWGDTRYVVTERFLLRNGAVVECWG